MTRIKKDGMEKKPRLGNIPKLNIKSAIKWLPFMGIIVTYLILFIFLKGKLLTTPDMDRSDAFHFNISLKYFLWESIQKWSLPFWTQKLQGGFPLMAEGQIGALFLPNLILMRLFDFVTAYNGLFVLSLFLLTVGMYLLLRKLSISKLLSLLLSFIFTFNGAITFRFIHFNLLQTYSLVPLIFFVILQWHKTDKKIYGLIGAFLISQMIFAGHFQVAFIALFSLFLWYLLVLGGKHKWGFIFIILSGFVMALPQLIPTYMLTKASSRVVSGGYSFATLYSLPWKHIFSFLVPYPFGSAKMGTYPNSLSQWGIFWENSPHLGVLFFACFIPVFVFLLFKKKLSKFIVLTLFLGLFFILLSLGSNSPFYFIFDIFPFSLFRTPPKYLLQAVFFIILGSAYCFEIYLKTRKDRFLKTIIYSFLVCNVVYLGYIAFSYHVFLRSDTVLQPPPALSSLSSSGKYITYGYSKIWHDILSQSGWKTDAELKKYQFLNNFLIPNSNLLFGRDSLDFNTGGLRIRRNDYIYSLTENAIFGSDYKGPSSYSAGLFMDLNQVKSVISSTPLSLDGLTEKKILTYSSIPIYVYQTASKFSTSYYFPKQAKNILYKEDLNILQEQGYISTESAVIEEYKDIPQNDIIKPIIQQSQEGYTGFFPQSTFIVFNESWYPELRVNLDAKQIKPIRTNLIHIGLMVPKGTHTVSITYEPVYFTLGVIISAIYCLLTLGGYFAVKKLKLHK